MPEWSELSVSVAHREDSVRAGNERPRLFMRVCVFACVCVCVWPSEAGRQMES